MKKASFEWTLTRILFILIVLVIILMSGGRILWDAGKAGLSLFGLVNTTETKIDYSELNKNAKSSFDVFINDINKCKLSKDTDCLCYTSLSDFKEFHNIEITDTEIKLINIKDKNKITMNKEKIQDFNCYYSSSLQIENPLVITFDDNLPEIKTGFFSKDIQFYHNTPIYKSTKTCLVSTSSNLIKTGKICKI